MLKIHTNETNPATLKLLIAANYAGKSVNVVKVLVNDRTIEEPRHLPVVEFAPDCNIFIVNAALNQILPPTKTNASDINEWLEWESTTLTPVVGHIFGSSTKSKQLKDALATSLEKLEAVLNKKLYLVGDSISICDISIWSTLYPLFKDDALSKEYLTNRVNILKFMTNLEQQEQVKKALSTYSVEKGSSSYQALLNGAKYLVSTPAGESPSSPNAPQAQLQSETTVTEEEILAAEKAWARDASKIVKHQERSGVVLPKTGEDNILITSALPYVNNVPHLGNIIGCVLSADVFARFSRLCNKNTFFLCGTDEYGTATETKALEEKLTCQEICDKYHKIHNEIYQWFNISFDHFGRTSTAHQKELCQDIFLQLHKNGFMFTQSVEQLHCENCNKFLADRFVEGGCPNIGCTYEDARGDQCDGCGKLVNAVELKNPRCKTCGQTPVLKTSEQFFMDLPKLEPQLRDWVKESSPGWSNNAQVIAKAWLKEGLKPRCITRDLKWGVSVPLKGYTEKVFYVWFDAPIGYMSISKAYSAEWLKWWQPEKNTKVTLYHFMAKDNVPFHSIMFPATLLGCKRGYTTVSHIMATEYLNYEDGKFSKSRGVGVFGTDAKDTGIISDVWRFYLLYVRPESQDSSFSWADLVTKNNSELLNNLGNFINRGLVFCKNNFNKVIPKLEPTKDDYTLLALCTKELKGYISSLEKCKLRDGIRYILAISKHGNQYMQSTQPWVLLKGSEQDQIRAGTVIGICCNISCLLATLLHPYMPETSDKLFKQLNTKSLSLSLTNVEVLKLLPEGHTIGEPYPLFAKIEPSQVDELKAKYGGVQSSTKASDADIKKLEEDITKQGLEVRKLKESGAAKTVVQPQVDKLLALKAKLAAATGDPKLTGKTAKKAKPASNNTPPQNNTKATESEIKNLEEEVAKQALEVRKLKEGGAAKTVWQPEVEKLLALKAKLTAASGDSKPAAKAPTKKEKPVDTPQANGEVKNDIKAIEEMVAAQAAVVRKLKEGGSDKSVIDPEVKKLLDLKAKLVEAGGAPAPPPKGKKSKKNK